jgi:hypothetical protein
MSARQVVVAAAVLGVALRLAFSLLYWVGKPLTHDEREYLRLGRSIAAGRGFVDDWTPPAEAGTLPPERFGRAPVYPAFLALATAGGRTLPPDGDLTSLPASVKVAQSLLGAVGILLLARIAQAAAGPGAGAAAALIAAVYPPLVWIAGYALSEALYWVLALGAVAALSPLTDRETAAASAGGVGPDARRPRPGADGARAVLRRALAAGALAGVAALTRPATVVFIAMAAGWLGWRRRWLAAAGIAAAALVVILPWTARNVSTYGRLVLIASEGGVTFWTGNHPLSPGEGDMAANPPIKRANQELRRRHPGLTPEEMEPIYYQEALAYIRAHPLDWIALLGRKVFYTWIPIGPSYTLHSTRYFAATIVSYGLLFGAACMGYRLLRRAAAPPRALWLLAASLLVVCVVFFPQERFRIPVLDPTLIVCAAAWPALRPRTESEAAFESAARRRRQAR